MEDARKPAQFVEACEAPLNRLFANFVDAGVRGIHDRDEERRELRARVKKGVRSLSLSDKTLGGDPAGWAAGLVYWLATKGFRPCGVPNVQNSELEKCFGVSMSTIRKRAAQVGALVKY